jgi:uncharacterized membrane protein YkvA (DUF1232 family)
MLSTAQRCSRQNTLRAAGRSAALERSVRHHCGAAIPPPAATVKAVADFFEDMADGVFPAGSDASRKETAFALRYAATEIDIIPDFVPEIGYADDSLIVRTVLSRHQDVFRDYCRFRKIRWSKISLALREPTTARDSSGQDRKRPSEA